MCKICYELQFIQTDFDVYKKIKSADVLWGARKKLNIDNTKDTIIVFFLSIKNLFILERPKFITI